MTPDLLFLPLLLLGPIVLTPISYSGVENPVFFKENTDMLLGDAKVTCDQIKAALTSI